MSHVGVIVLHGLGGTPHSVLPVTAAVHAAGHPTVAPMLAGHGRSPEDLASCTWNDWLHGVDAAADELRHRCDHIVVIGQSMGGTLALHLAATRSDVVAVATINAPALGPDPDTIEHLETLVGRGQTMQSMGDPDIRDPEAHDSTSPELPIRALIEMAQGAGVVHDLLGTVSVPVMVVTSDHDNVVDPVNSEAIADGVRGPVTRLRLRASGHVAALDLDRERLCRELMSWLVDLTD